MRWVFLLLLLVNTIYFGWQMQQPAEKKVEVASANVSRIRLLSEVDRTLLLPRSLEVTPLSVKQMSEEPQPTAIVAEPVEVWCQVISGIGDKAVAQELRQRLESQGLVSQVISADVERVLAYELTLDKPLQSDGQQALIDNLAELGLTAEEARINNKPVYIIGRYGSRAELNQSRNALIGLFQPDEYQVVSQESLFEVWVETESSVETGNKIKEVDQFLNSSIKIEKKLCKGVASTGVRD